MSVEYVDVATARELTGTRLITSAVVPSPWSEAAKGLFAIAYLPLQVIGKRREDAEAVTAWTGIDNVPILLHDNEPARTNWAAIVGLVGRLDLAGAVVPTGPRTRAAMFGHLEMIAGEQGLGWTARLAMIQASFESGGERGFSVPVATYLAKRYGHSAAIASSELRDHVATLLGVLREELDQAAYFGGERPHALDVYAATFLTPLSDIDEAACPQLTPALRRAFGAAKDLLGELVPAELWAHRQRMFERHLAWPIRLA